MTREEVIKALIKERKTALHENKQAFDMAIKALEQQPNEDCVSRKELLKLYGNRAFELQMTHQTDKQLGINWCINTLKEMPPVTPTQKWIPVSERLPKEFEFVNCTCHSLIDDREDWVVETVYVPQPSGSPYSDWGNIPLLNGKKCEVIAWMHRNIPEPYKAEMESEE